MKAVSIKLPAHLSSRTAALKEKTGLSESDIIRQAVEVGLARVEEGFDFIHAENKIEVSEPVPA